MPLDIIIKPPPPNVILLAITITLKGKAVDHLTPKQQLELSLSDVKDWLKLCDGKASLIAEIQPKSLNVHYHGFLELPLRSDGPDGPLTILDYHYWMDCKKRKLRKIGFFELRSVADEQGWYNYCNKEIIKTRYRLQKDPIVLDDLNKFSSDIITQICWSA